MPRAPVDSSEIPQDCHSGSPTPSFCASTRRAPVGDSHPVVLPKSPALPSVSAAFTCSFSPTAVDVRVSKKVRFCSVETRGIQLPSIFHFEPFRVRKPSLILLYQSQPIQANRLVRTIARIPTRGAIQQR